MKFDRYVHYKMKGTEPTDYRRRYMCLVESVLGERSKQEQASPALMGAVENVLASLMPREQEILRLRYGLAITNEAVTRQTLRQIGAHYGVTPEKIRQIERRGLAHLRHPLRSRLLQQFFESDEHTQGEEENGCGSAWPIPPSGQNWNGIGAP